MEEYNNSRKDAMKQIIILVCMIIGLAALSIIVPGE